MSPIAFSLKKINKTLPQPTLWRGLGGNTRGNHTVDQALLVLPLNYSPSRPSRPSDVGETLVVLRDAAADVAGHAGTDGAR